MIKQIRCECGYLARGTSDDEVVALIQTHVGSDHPELAKAHTVDYIRNWIELVPE